MHIKHRRREVEEKEEKHRLNVILLELESTFLDFGSIRVDVQNATHNAIGSKRKTTDSFFRRCSNEKKQNAVQ